MVTSMIQQQHPKLMSQQKFAYEFNRQFTHLDAYIEWLIQPIHAQQDQSRELNMLGLLQSLELFISFLEASRDRPGINNYIWIIILLNSIKKSITSELLSQMISPIQQAMPSTPHAFIISTWRDIITPSFIKIWLIQWSEDITFLPQHPQWNWSSAWLPTIPRYLSLFVLNRLRAAGIDI